MTDRRQKNANWNVNSSDGMQTWDGAQLAVLMDIRDELQALRRRADCYETLQIPALLRAIKRNTTKPRKRKK
jgi:hypothetical protein